MRMAQMEAEEIEDRHQHIELHHAEYLRLRSEQEPAERENDAAAHAPSRRMLNASSRGCTRPAVSGVSTSAE